MAIIITKNSSISGNIPSSLAQGELAINVVDGRLFYGSGSNSSVKEFTASGSGGTVATASYAVTASYALNGGGGSTTPGGSSTQIQYNNSSAFGGVPTLTYDGSTLRGTGSFSGSFVGQLTGTASWASNAISSSYAVTSSHAVSAKNASTIDINVFGSPVDSYVLMSNVAGTTGVSVGGDADLRYNASTNVLTVGNVSATTLTGSLLGTASWASYATTASYVLNAISSSYAATASLAPNYLLISDTGSMLQPYVLTSATASMLQPYVLSSSTSSFVTNAQTSSMSVATASYVLNAISSSYAATASYFSGTVTSASYAVTASYVTEFQHTTTGFSGNYMMPVQAYQNTTFTGGIADGIAVVRYYPFIPSANTKIASIGAVVRATSSPGTGSYRLGIYNSVDATVAGGPSKLPGSLLIDVGLISNTTITAAAVEIAIAVGSQPTLQKGVVYWAAIAPSGSGTTCPGPSNNVVFNNYLGWSALGSAGLTPAIGITVNSDAGTGFAATAVTASYTFMNSTNVKMWPTFRISGSSV